MSAIAFERRCKSLLTTLALGTLVGCGENMDSAESDEPRASDEEDVGSAGAQLRIPVVPQLLLGPSADVFFGDDAPEWQVNGDLVIRPVGLSNPIEMHNVLRVGGVVRAIELMVKEKVVLTQSSKT